MRLMLLFFCSSAALANGSIPQQTSFNKGTEQAKAFASGLGAAQKDPEAQKLLKAGKSGPYEDSTISESLKEDIQNIAADRQKYEFDPEKDSFFQQAAVVAEDPMGSLQGSNNPEKAQSPQYTYATCIEDKLAPTATCEYTIDYDVVADIFPRQDGVYTFSHGNVPNELFKVERCGKHKGHKIYCYYVSNNDAFIKRWIAQLKGLSTPHVRITQKVNVGHPHAIRIDKRGYVHTHYQIHYVQDEFVRGEKLVERHTDNCKHLNELVAKGLYRYESQQCVDHQGTDKQRFFGAQSKKRECWSYQRTYTAVVSPGTKACDALRKRGCEQVSSECYPKKTKPCVRVKQFFRCPVGAPQSTRLQRGALPFCVDGKCAEKPLTQDEGFDEAVVQMSLLAEMDKAQKNHEVNIFTGERKACEKTWYKKCCGTGKSFIQSLTGSKCGEEAKLLAAARSKKYCHYVGNHAVKQKFGLVKKTIGHKEVYCCFPSVLLRVFNEEGRNQLNKGWGHAKSPDCRGFTLEELQHLDFSKMDLSEAHEELQKQVVNMTKGKQRAIQSRIQRKLKAMNMVGVK